MDATSLPLPPEDPTGAADWVDAHLSDCVADEPTPSPSFRGGQRAADAALAAFDVAGYARTRNEVWPSERQGASRLSPYIRHGLLDLPTVWAAVADGPRADRDKFRDELGWQEYARHLYARLGPAMAAPLRAEPVTRGEPPVTPAPGTGSPSPAPDPWDPEMACMQVAAGSLRTDGWVVNQARMWLASQWSVRHGRDWRAGEEAFFRHLLDGSRAANRTGWQWTIGTGTGRRYGFSRAQVERRAPGLCATCALEARCPVADWPAADREGPPLPDTDPRLRHDPDPEATGGPREPRRTGHPTAVWLTAESLGDADPALQAHPELPAVFVFDVPLLTRLQLSGKRLIFFAETLGDLASRRPLEVWRGDPVEVLADRALATTFAPVPGWRRRSAALDVQALYPWPWLVRPHGRSVRSFTAWAKAAGLR